MVDAATNVFDTLPQDWSVARVNEIATLSSGGTPSKKRREFWSGSIPWASPKDMKTPWLHDTQDHISQEGLDDGSRLAPTGSLFIVVRGMILAKDLPVSMAMVPMAFNQDMKAIHTGDGVDAEFVLHAFSAYKSHLIREIGTSAHGTRRISTQAIEEFKIPLPPLAEQRAIAGVLRTVERAKEATEKMIAAAQQLKQSLMRHFFTFGPVPFQDADHVELQQSGVGEIPAEWQVVTLEDVSEFLQYGTSKRCELEPVGNPVLRIPNVVHDVIDTTELKYGSFDKTELEKMTLADGDILFVRTNGRKEYIGRCAVYRGEPPDSLFASYLIRARLLRERLDPNFFQFYATTEMGRSFLSGRATSASDGKFNINTQILKQVQLPEPSMEVQKEVVDAIQRVESKERRERERATALSALFDSLLHELMTGQRRVNDLDLDFAEEEAV